MDELVGCNILCFHFLTFTFQGQKWSKGYPLLLFQATKWNVAQGYQRWLFLLIRPWGIDIRHQICSKGHRYDKICKILRFVEWEKISSLIAILILHKMVIRDMKIIFGSNISFLVFSWFKIIPILKSTIEVSRFKKPAIKAGKSMHKAAGKKYEIRIMY